MQHRRSIRGVPLCGVDLRAIRRTWVVLAGLALWLLSAGALAAPLPAPPEDVATASRIDAAGRETDRLIAALQRVAADYGGAVREGAVLDARRYGEQTRLIEEITRLAASLSLPPELQETLSTIRGRIEAKAPPSEVYEACRDAIPGVIAARWAWMTPPSPTPLERAAPLFAERCASCHGATGDGRGPTSATLDPKPRAFSDPELADLTSPYRAFDAISFGIPGTSMPGVGGLTEEERWGLAFQVLAFAHTTGSNDSAWAAEEGARAAERAHLAVPSLEELALRTDRDLALWLAARLPPTSVAPALVYLRTVGVDRAAASPFEPMRRKVREAARAYRSDPGRAGAIVAEVTRRYGEVTAEVRRRDWVVGDGADDVLSRLARAIAEKAPDAEVQAMALRAFSVLGSAEAALAKPPRSGLAAHLEATPKWVTLVVPVALVAGALLLAWSRSAQPNAAGAPAAPSAAPSSRPVPVWAALLAAGLAIAVLFVALQRSRAGARGAGASEGASEGFTPP